MSAPAITVGVLAIQGAFLEHVNMIQRVAREMSASVRITVVEVRKPDQVAGLDGLIIPGGESTTLSVFLRKNSFEETLKSWMFNEKRPGVVWGTCAGLIMLSDDLAGQKQGGQITLGGLDVQSKRNKYGRQLASFEGKVKLQDSFLSGSHNSCSDKHPHDEYPGVFLRAPGIERINSPSVKVLATLAGEEDNIVAVHQGSIMATSFHPELTDDTRWHSYFINTILSSKIPVKDAISFDQ